MKIAGIHYATAGLCVATTAACILGVQNDALRREIETIRAENLLLSDVQARENERSEKVMAKINKIGRAIMEGKTPTEVE